jgi:hypothetical protein
VLEDVADLLRHQPRVDRDQHRAGPGDAVVRLQQLVPVRREEGDAIVPLDPPRLERTRQQAGTLAQLDPGQVAVSVDDRDPLGKRGSGAFEEGERC